MRPATIILPAKLRGETLIKLIEDLGQLDHASLIAIDFSKLKRITPVGLTTLTAFCNKHEVDLLRLNECTIFAYLQRMDFLKQCGVGGVSEAFMRRTSKNRFVPVAKIAHRVDQMGGEIAACLAPGGDDFEHELADLYDYCWYVFTELANNIFQHSGGKGFASAQVTPGDGMVRIALADNGRGIRGSLEETALEGSEVLSDESAILKALEPQVSSKGQPSNEGVGLTLVKELNQLTGSWLLICSGSGIAMIDAGGELRSQTLKGKGFSGTIVAMVARLRNVHDFGDLLERAKVNVNLLPMRRKSVKFRP